MENSNPGGKPGKKGRKTREQGTLTVGKNGLSEAWGSSREKSEIATGLVKPKKKGGWKGSEAPERSHASPPPLQDLEGGERVWGAGSELGWKGKN